ncbi:hypothetical protein CBR_g36831 [Chara braunii]|uniref:DUF659 domain-containing protein n=1 Tax=Chara braunii TaxID=69332 RepID=A0A388LLP6_CHABU|nr:hypothetical protein CBR_g36831 [Chara braunii]|eukprot:GBG83217.1 hypothetical protein CBR_g36831 [Chara braunii]
MRPLTAKWDNTGCTLITDGCTDRRYRPVMNFIGTGESGAILLKVVDVSKKKKTAIALAMMWEQVIRDIGVQRVNAICTDNAEVNKQAARILGRHTDRDISSIPWVPCAAHCLSLLMKDICELDWVKEVVQRTKMMVKFIRRHHHTASLYTKCSELSRELTLILPTEVRFASSYMMMNRFWGRRRVLEDMMEEGWRLLRWSARKDRDKSDTTYMTVTGNEWWVRLSTVLDVLEPIYELLRKMDRNGTAPPSLWHFDEGLRRRLNTLTGLTDVQRQAIMKAVRKRTKMMRQPVHAANFLLDPRRRDMKWLMDMQTPLVQNTLKFFLSQCKEEVTWGCREQLDLWADLQAFHREPTGDVVKDPVTGKVVEESFWTEFAKFDSSLTQMTASEWWNAHGASHKKLRDIVVRVTTMWSTANPCERNWSSLDLVHDKRRGPLSPDSLAKLVYVHWNLQLLDIKKKSMGSLAGYLDMWAAFFDDVEAPPPNDPAALPKAATVADLTGDELQRQQQHQQHQEPVQDGLQQQQEDGLQQHQQQHQEPAQDGLLQQQETGQQQLQQQHHEGLQQQQPDEDGLQQHQQQQHDGLQQQQQEKESAQPIARVNSRRPQGSSAAAILDAVQTLPFPPEIEDMQHDNLDVSLAGRKRKVQPDTGPKVARKRGRLRKHPLPASAGAAAGVDGAEGGEVQEHVIAGRKVQGGPTLAVDGVETGLRKRPKWKAAKKARVVEDDPTDSDAEESSSESDEEGRESDWE